VGGTEYIIGFEGSQALSVCPSGKCKLLTGTIEVYFFYLFIFVGVGGLTGCFWDYEDSECRLLGYRRNITSPLQSAAG
jgi:hypothetical protein